MNIGWAILINTILGVVLYFPLTFVFVIIMYRKYKDNPDIIDQVLDDFMNQADECYQLFVSDVRIMHAISFMITFMFWEIVLPIIYYKIADSAKELSKLRK